jgi:hypothetical protein
MGIQKEIHWGNLREPLRGQPKEFEMVQHLEKHWEIHWGFHLVKHWGCGWEKKLGQNWLKHWEIR